jgi:hypothetical protein
MYIYVPSLPKPSHKEHKIISTLHYRKQLLERQQHSILISYENKAQTSQIAIRTRPLSAKARHKEKEVFSQQQAIAQPAGHRE